MSQKTFRKTSLTAVAIAASAALLGVFGAGTASAQATDELTAGTANAAVGDALSAGLASGGSATFTTSLGTITCTTAGFDATVASNPTAGTGLATETVTGLSFSNCTTTVFGTIGVTSIGLTKGTTATATLDDTNIANGVIDLDVSPSITVVLRSILGSVTCHYGGAITGTADNADSALAFTDQTQTLQTGSSGLCASSGSFTATYGPVVDENVLDANGNPTAVTVN